MNTTPLRIFYFTEFKLMLIINRLIFHQQLCNTTGPIKSKSPTTAGLAWFLTNTFVTLPHFCNTAQVGLFNSY
jgi:hypothetical protein